MLLPLNSFLCQLKHLTYGYFDLVVPPDEVAVCDRTVEKSFVGKQTKADGMQPARKIQYDAAAVFKLHFQPVVTFGYDIFDLNHHYEPPLYK